MGAGGSTGRQPNPMAPGHAEAEQVEEEHAEWRSPRTLEGLEEPHPGTEEDSKCFYAMLAEEEMGRRPLISDVGVKVVLEVSKLGFRLLRPTGEPMALFTWGQIHSWAHVACTFAFRYFDESEGTILRISLALRDMDLLLEWIQHVVDHILSEKKRLAISPDDFTEIMRRMDATEPSGRLDVLTEVLKERYFFSKQGTKLMQCLPTTFDKVEAAVLLHGRLVDQVAFSQMLEDADCQGDKDNIWHRITSLRKVSSIARKGTRTKPGT